VAACHHPQNVTAEEIAAARRSPASPNSSGEEIPGADEPTQIPGADEPASA
jgi:hypothetical protein